MGARGIRRRTAVRVVVQAGLVLVVVRDVLVEHRFEMLS
jgi:hypothetical protein